MFILYNIRVFVKCMIECSCFALQSDSHPTASQDQCDLHWGLAVLLLACLQMLRRAILRAIFAPSQALYLEQNLMIYYLNMYFKKTLTTIYMHMYTCILTIHCGVGSIETLPFHRIVCDKFHCQGITGRKKWSWHCRSTECAN